jgi:hypothetical protein
MHTRHALKASIQLCVTDECPEPPTKVLDKALVQLMENVGGNGIMNVAVREPNPEGIRDGV